MADKKQPVLSIPATLALTKMGALRNIPEGKGVAVITVNQLRNLVENDYLNEAAIQVGTPFQSKFASTDGSFPMMVRIEPRKSALELALGSTSDQDVD